MKFVQIVEMRTSKVDQIQKLAEDYDAETEGKRTSGHTLVCQDRDDPGRYFVIVEFESPEAAKKNDELVESSGFAQKQAALLDGPPKFYNLDVLHEASS